MSSESASIPDPAELLGQAHRLSGDYDELISHVDERRVALHDLESKFDSLVTTVMEDVKQASQDLSEDINALIHWREDATHHLDEVKSALAHAFEEAEGAVKSCIEHTKAVLPALHEHEEALQTEFHAAGTSVAQDLIAKVERSAQDLSSRAETALLSAHDHIQAEALTLSRAKDEMQKISRDCGVILQDAAAVASHQLADIVRSLDEFARSCFGHFDSELRSSIGRVAGDAQTLRNRLSELQNALIALTDTTSATVATANVASDSTNVALNDAMEVFEQFMGLLKDIEDLFHSKF